MNIQFSQIIRAKIWRNMLYCTFEFCMLSYVISIAHIKRTKRTTLLFADISDNFFAHTVGSVPTADFAGDLTPRQGVYEAVGENLSCLAVGDGLDELQKLLLFLLPFGADRFEQLFFLFDGFHSALNPTVPCTCAAREWEDAGFFFARFGVCVYVRGDIRCGVLRLCIQLGDTLLYHTDFPVNVPQVV